MNIENSPNPMWVETPAPLKLVVPGQVHYNIVFNPGNAYTKVMVIGDKSPTVMPSGISWKNDGESREARKDFRILRSPLIRSPLFASGAWWCVDANGERPLDFESGGKPVYAVPLLISAMWKRFEADNATDITIRAFVQVHNPKQAAADIRERMNNTFFVSRDGVERKITIDVKVVCREGAHMNVMLSPNAISVVLDWGGNTAIATRYDGKNRAHGFDPLPEDGVGASGLARSLVSNHSHELLSGSRSIARANELIRKPKFENEALAEIFGKACETHIRGALLQINRRNPGILDNVDNVYTIGGLCLCQPFADALQRFNLPGFNIPKNPQTIDINNMALKYANFQD